MTERPTIQSLPRTTRVAVWLALAVGAFVSLITTWGTGWQLFELRDDASFEMCFDCGPMWFSDWVAWPVLAALGGSLVVSSIALLRGGRRGLGGFLACSSALGALIAIEQLRNVARIIEDGRSFGPNLSGLLIGIAPAVLVWIAAALVAREIR